MKYRASAKQTALISSLICFHIGGICQPASMSTQRVDAPIRQKLKPLIEREREQNNRLVPKRIVRWKFEGNEGAFLLADIHNKRTHSCIIYMINGDVFLSLGGNDQCSWTQNPIRVDHGKKSWIEFRPTINKTTNTPISINEFTAHFQKGSGSVCILGLPNVGYDSLRCPNDEAPDSQ